MHEINVTCARIVKGVYHVYWERFFLYQVHNLKHIKGFKFSNYNLRIPNI